MGISNVSCCQAEILNRLLNTSENFAIAASYGCGKTLLYGIAAVNKVNTNVAKPQVLILCTTYEAAVQTANILSRIAMYTKVNVSLATKDMALARRSKLFTIANSLTN